MHFALFVQMLCHFVNVEGANDVFETGLSNIRDFSRDPNRARYVMCNAFVFWSWTFMCHLLKRPSNGRDMFQNFGIGNYESIRPWAITNCEGMPTFFRAIGDTTYGTHICKFPPQMSTQRFSLHFTLSVFLSVSVSPSSPLSLACFLSFVCSISISRTLALVLPLV